MKNKLKLPNVDKIVVISYAIICFIIIGFYEYIGQLVSLKELLQMITIYGIIQVYQNQEKIKQRTNNLNERLILNTNIDKEHYIELTNKIRDLRNEINTKIVALESEITIKNGFLAKEFKELGRLEGKLDIIKKELKELQIKSNSDGKR